jgi:hypothetical protein
LCRTLVSLQTTPPAVDKPARGPEPRRAVIVNVSRPCELRKDGGRGNSVGCSEAMDEREATS